MTKKLKCLWVMIAIMILIKTLYLHHLNPSPEISLNGMISMVAITLPLGLLIVIVLNIITMVTSNIFSMTVPDNYLTLTISWLILFGAGYYQWFVVVPALFVKYKKKGSKKLQGDK